MSGLKDFASTPYAPAVAKYEAMSKTADKFASNPIVIAKAITRAVTARRPAARYVAPRSNNMIFLMSAFLPRRMWDWAMRLVGSLNAKTLDFTKIRSTMPATESAAPLPPVAKPVPEIRAPT